MEFFFVLVTVWSFVPKENNKKSCFTFLHEVTDSMIKSANT